MENSRDVFGQRISDPVDQSEARTTTGFRISTHEVEEGFFSTENQDGDGFGQRGGGKWRSDVGSPFSTGEERRASPEMSHFRCNFRFTRLLIVRERVGVESKVTPLSNSQEMRSPLVSIIGMTDDRR